ncbi:MAG: FapA family protein [Chloroflexota bacterium]|nr:FapA family protein [Chloroflexota bacterium]
MISIKRLFVVAVGLALVLALLTMGVVLAQGGLLGGKILSGSDVTIPAGEVVDHDIYVFGGSLTSNGTINGDVVAIGGTIAVNGPVKGDVLAAGGSISISGPISGDVRVAGGQVSVAGDITEDVLAAGGSVAIGGRIGQDLIVSGGQLTLTGSVAGSAIGNAGTYSKSGTIAGTDSITITGNRAATVTRAPSNPVLDAIRQFIVVLLVAVLGLWFAPRMFAAAEAQVRQRPLPSFGWGLAAVVAYIVLIVVIFVLMILLAIAFGSLGFDSLVGIDVVGGIVLVMGITLTFLVATGFVAQAVVGLALARFVAGETGRTVFPDGSRMLASDRWADVGLLAAGVAIVVILTALPVVGGLATFVVADVGLGALWLASGRWRPRTFASTTSSAPPAESGSASG